MFPPCGPIPHIALLDPPIKPPNGTPPPLYDVPPSHVRQVVQRRLSDDTATHVLLPPQSCDELPSRPHEIQINTMHDDSEDEEEEEDNYLMTQTVYRQDDSDDDRFNPCKPEKNEDTLLLLPKICTNSDDADGAPADSAASSSPAHTQPQQQEEEETAEPALTIHFPVGQAAGMSHSTPPPQEDNDEEEDTYAPTNFCVLPFVDPPVNPNSPAKDICSLNGGGDQEAIEVYSKLHMKEEDKNSNQDT